MSSPDFAAMGLLDGLETEARRGRLALLEALYADGCPAEELRVATGEGRLALLPAERSLGATGTMSVRGVAAEAGVEPGALRATRRATGLPLPDDDDAAVLGAPDLAGARALASFLDGGLPLDELIEASRVFGEAAARAAAAARTVAVEALPRRGDTELELSMRLRDATRDFVPRAAELLGVLYVLHRRELLRSEFVSAGDVSAGRLPDVHDVTIAFCDLVGYTRLGERVAADDLGAIATRLAVLAADAVRPPVRLVKTLGDAAMLVAPEPDALAHVLLDLMDATGAEGEGFPDVHAGMAHGPALQRWGDWYGGTVNLAARLADTAPAGFVLADARVHAHADDPRLDWAAAGPKALPGVSAPVDTFTVRRAAAEPDGSGTPRAVGP
jgi:adenylate cyclase